MAESRFLEVVPEIKELLAEENWPGLNLILGDWQPAEIAEAWDAFTLEEKLAILRHFEVSHAVDIFENLDTERQIRLLQHLREERATALLDEMAPDERADLFAEFPPPLAERFLRRMEAEEAQDVRDLLRHEPDTAGGLMTTDFAWAPAEATVAEAIEMLRENFQGTELVYYVYVLGEGRKLLGVVTLRQLIQAPPSTRLGDIMFTNLVTLPADMDQEEVAREAALYDFLALPVVDGQGRMLGIVTHDDVVDVLEEEAGEDLEKFGALIPGDEEAGYLAMPVVRHIRARIPWLIALLFLGSVSGFLLLHFERTMQGEFDPIWYVLLLSLTPMLCGTAGNAGTQAATVVIRALATGELDLRAIGRVLRKELLVGMSMGAILALCGFARSLLSPQAVSVPQAVVFGTVVAVSVFFTITYATTTGALLPLLFKRLRLDPAVMSGPLLATVNDSIVIVIYFTVALTTLAQLTPR